MKIEATPTFFKSLKELGSLKSKWYAFRAWFKYHFNKENFHLMKTAFKGRPWDIGFLYDLEKAKIEEMIAYHEKHKTYLGVERDIKYMKICINLIDIFTEKTELFHYDGQLKFKPVEGSDNMEMDGSELVYHCLVNVNLKNAKRFAATDNDKEIEYFKKFPHEFYIKKAKYLYHKIRNERDGSWWD